MNGYEPPDSPYRVPFDGAFVLAKAPSEPPEGTEAPAEPVAESEAPDLRARKGLARRETRRRLKKIVGEISDLQRRLYADDRYAVLVIFQAMDAAGKDSTIRAVTTGVNPAGFQVFSFKAPSREELDHDFLWRTAKRLPERGRIGIFNRSYYEEALVVRVHPGFLDGQRLPRRPALDELWDERFQSIRDHELHLARNGTVILKLWLNVSRAEQARRFLRRLDRPDKNWKFSSGDLEERRHWDEYMVAYEDALNATSRPWAPWYAIPADDKSFMRLRVAELIRDQLARLDLRFPTLPEKELAKIDHYRKELETEV